MKVSVIIVSMNNLDLLYPCLDSIVGYTKCSYEIIVVAFFFSKENLRKLRKDYPNIIIIESNEYRGFSENNNLALRVATGEYCFVVNDDTYSDQPVIDRLVETIESLQENVAVVSPTTLNTDGSVQRCGKPKYNLLTYVLFLMHIICLYENNSKYVNKKGIFQTYNISGACFLIKRDVFQQMGWFDERYYFCPEDIALSDKLNKSGYKCYVDADVKITHVAGGTWSTTLMATKPAQVKGEMYFYGGDSVVKRFVYCFVSLVFYPLYAVYWFVRYSFKRTDKHHVFYRAYINASLGLLSCKTPKELFIKYYKKSKKSQ